eukprot:scaffold137_cov398-Prasinococcus_capsulatus_cf.AAC.34
MASSSSTSPPIVHVGYASTTETHQRGGESQCRMKKLCLPSFIASASAAICSALCKALSCTLSSDSCGRAGPGSTTLSFPSIKLPTTSVNTANGLDSMPATISGSHTDSSCPRAATPTRGLSRTGLECLICRTHGSEILRSRLLCPCLSNIDTAHSFLIAP